MSASVLVVGAGSWGTALAVVLANNGHNVQLLARDAEQASRLNSQHENQRYLPGIILPTTIQCRASLVDAEKNYQAIIIAVPCSAVRQVLAELKADSSMLPIICLACKGLEAETQMPGHQIVLDVLGQQQPVAILSGPSFAAETARGLPTAVTVAASDDSTASVISDLFHNNTFRIYTNTDLDGVAIAGAVKNVLAIAAGIADGLGFGANTRAALITRGLAEISRFGIALGGKPETFIGLSGLGDLLLTCTDDQSRNRRLGLALARGDSLQQARAQIGQAIEGTNTAAEVCVLAKRLGIDMPISEQVLAVIQQNVTPEDAVRALLTRDPKAEVDT